LKLETATRTRAPSVPPGLLKKTKERWAAFWKSDYVRTVRDEHLPALERLFVLYDESERAMRAVKRKRMVKGSQGQPVQNPLLKYVESCNKEIRALEDRFGLTPGAMQRLGGAAEFGQSLDEMNRELAEDVDEDPRRLKAVK
jgi:P27 family predicted phage terminase small subunit